MESPQFETFSKQEENEARQKANRTSSEHEFSKPDINPLARSVSNPEACKTAPERLILLEIACSGKECEKNIVYKWICQNCREKLSYGFNHHVYCKCGKVHATCLEFKCPDKKHGNNFVQHNEDVFTALLASLGPQRDINILILGETGVGKSTWINGFINFVTYDSLEKAGSGKPINLIPSSFTVCDEDYEEIRVKTGEDKNEDLDKVGQSATQTAKVYQFNVGNVRVRFIDTPGIGDTRGIDQDKKNFESILGTLSHFEEIHGICILLKPNNARLNVMFRFCIKELLTYLHKDASNNIVFCFTNSRSTFYRPGDTLPALKELLAENEQVKIPLNKKTIYCYDSEAYRFLAAVKNNPPVKFSEEEKANFKNSWEKSCQEVLRMLETLCGLKPHPIKSTINLNHVRELVLKLARPLAEINRNILTNKSIVEDEKREIERTKDSIKELRKRRKMTRTVIKVIEINYPKTVCSNSSCIEIVPLHNTNTNTTKYTKACHNHCYITGIKRDTLGDPQLMGCTAMGGGQFCMNCKHNYKEHLHVYYDSVQNIEEVDDPSVMESLNRNENAAEMKQRMIAARDKEIYEYTQELNFIEQASAKFAYFLKHNAITPYNDAMEEYITHLIQEEKTKSKKSGNLSTLENLKKSRESYIVQKKILEQEIAKGSVFGCSPPGPKDIEVLVEKLKVLKHSGKSLVKALACLDNTAGNVYNETIVDQSHTNPSKAWYQFWKPKTPTQNKSTTGIVPFR